VPEAKGLVARCGVQVHNKVSVILLDGKRDGWIIVVDGGAWRRRRWWWCMMMGANILIHVLLLLPYCIALPIHPRLELELDGTADDGWGCG